MILNDKLKSSSITHLMIFTKTSRTNVSFIVIIDNESKFLSSQIGLNIKTNTQPNSTALPSETFYTKNIKKA